MVGACHRESVPFGVTEWQRMMEFPPAYTLPNYQSLVPPIRDAHESGHIDGDFFWGLTIQPAYLQRPRRNGRVNGLFHEDGSPFDLADHAALGGHTRSFPDEWDDHSFPYPESNGWWSM